MVTFEYFVRPALLKMQGTEQVFRCPVTTIAENDFSSRSDRVEFIRAVTRYENGKFFSSVTSPQGSAILSSMIRSNSLLQIPGEMKTVRKGDSLTCLLFEFPLSETIPG